MKRAIIVGCNGQDGQLLSKLLLKKKYEILGIDKGVGRSLKGLRFKVIDISKSEEVFNIVKRFKPKEIYHLAAFHHSSEEKFIDNVELFEQSYNVNVRSLVNFLEAMRKCLPRGRLFYAASSHIFGGSKDRLQDEKTPINPKCIYGITKAAGLFTCRLYRDKYSIFASTGILYNHESYLRNESFLSKKIVKAAVNIKKKKQKELILGDLDAVADFGYAPDYVEAMHKILNIDRSDDFVIASGEKRSVLDFVKTTFRLLELDWKPYVKEDRNIVTKSTFCRIGNSKKLRAMTSWKPSVDFKGMIKLLLSKESVLDE